MDRRTQLLILGAAAVLILGAAALAVLNWAKLAQFFLSEPADSGQEVVPTTPEEKMRILESLPPLEDPLTAEEKRAILEGLSPTE